MKLSDFDFEQKIMVCRMLLAHTLIQKLVASCYLLYSYVLVYLSCKGYSNGLVCGTNASTGGLISDLSKGMLFSTQVARLGFSQLGFPNKSTGKTPHVDYTPLKLIAETRENRPGPERKQSSSNNLFSGASC